MSDLDVRDLRAAQERAAAARLAAIGPTSTISHPVQLGVRAVTAYEDWRCAADGRRYARRKNSISGHEREFTVNELAALFVDNRMIGPGESPLNPAELDEAYAAAVAEIERITAAPVRAVQVQTGAQGLAGCLATSRDIWNERDGSTWWDRRPADPIRGGHGRAPEPPAPDLPGTGMFARLRGRRASVGEPVTIEAIEAAVIAGGLLQQFPRPDYAAVLDELHQLATP